MEQQTNSEKKVPLSEIYRILKARGLRPIDYKDLPYETLKQLAGVK